MAGGGNKGLPVLAGCFRRLTMTTGDCQRLVMIPGDYSRLQVIAEDHSQLPLISIFKEFCLKAFLIEKLYMEPLWILACIIVMQAMFPPSFRNVICLFLQLEKWFFHKFPCIIKDC